MKWLNKAQKAVKSASAWIPLFGRLPEVSRQGLGQAFYETLTTLVFATMPFWILPTIGAFLFKPKPTLDQAFENGEGLVFAAVLLGPLFYVLTKRYGHWGLRRADQDGEANPLSVSFPYGTAFVAIIALTCVVSGLAFALLRKGSASSDINLSGIQTLSWFLIIGATVTFFLVSAYRNMLDDLASDNAEKVIEQQPNSENAFVDTWLGEKR